MFVWDQLLQWIRFELKQLAVFNKSDRPWEMPLAAALASGLPLFIGLYCGHLNWGLTASLGGLVFLYMPNTPLRHRMMILMVCSLGMTASYVVGLIFHFYPLYWTPAMIVITSIVTMICRYYALGPPGSLFFVMAAAIGLFTTLDVEHVPMYAGLIAMGCISSCAIGWIYSLYILRLKPAQPIPVLRKPEFDFVIFDSMVIGTFVGISLALAQLLQLERPYWVLVSCLAIIQGVTFRAAWNKQIHRIIGTVLGLSLALLLLSIKMSPLIVCLLMTMLIYMIESLVVRHYGLAVIFITPMTIFLVEAASLGTGDPVRLVQARLIDTLLGCVMGVVGAVCLHNPRLRNLIRLHHRK